MTRVLLVLASYFIGAIPTSYLVGRFAYGVDLRERGSGNLGATNAFRVLGWRAASPIFIADILKGFVPAFFFARLGGGGVVWALAFGAAAIIGHVYSVYVGFKGGKGVATGAGVFLALAPAAVLGGLVIWATIVFGTGYVSLASIVAAATLPVLVLITGAPTAVFALASVLAIFVIFAHRSNIGRLVRGEEHRFRRGAARAQRTR